MLTVFFVTGSIDIISRTKAVPAEAELFPLRRRTLRIILINLDGNALNSAVDFDYGRCPTGGAPEYITVVQYMNTDETCEQTYNTPYATIVFHRREQTRD
jgi:hypothetical protein